MRARTAAWIHAARFAPTAIGLSCLVTVSSAATEARAEEAGHAAVRGADLRQVDVVAVSPGPRAPVDRDGAVTVAWSAVSSARAPGKYRLRWAIGAPDGADAPAAVEVPVCAGRGSIALDGSKVAASGPAPVIVPLGVPAATHVLTVDVTVSAYEKRIACGAPARIGQVVVARDGLFAFAFASPDAVRGGGTAVAFVPPGHDATAPAAVLVGTHPWNGGPWTYAAYTELIDEAAARDVVLLFPSGLGNSLYTAPAEAEVMRALDALASRVAVDRRRTSIWGASMGGAGATTIGFHHPDRFATVTSLFGDSAYDLTTYVRAVLADDAAAHRVNALDVVENARNLPVWLIHGEADRVSPIVQSAQLARALEALGFSVRFDRVPGAGHEGPLVARFARAIVARAAEAHAPAFPARVTYRSVRAEDTGAYGVRLVRSSDPRAPGDAFVDVAGEAGAVHLRRADGVRAVVLAAGALGLPVGTAPPVVVDAPARGVRVEWETPSPAAR